MAVVKVIEIKGLTKDLQDKLQQVTDTIREQKEITIEFEKELQRLEKQLAQTPKTQLAAQTKLKDEINHVRDALKDQRLSLKELNLEKSDTTAAIKQSEGFKLTQRQLHAVDTATGGYAGKLIYLKQQLVDVKDAALAWVKSLNLSRAALIATGIGAFVVALGLVVAYWDEIVEFITKANQKLQEHIDILKSQNTLLDAEFKLLDAQQKLLESQGKSTDDLIDKKKLLLQTQLGILGAELALLQAQDERLDNQARELSFWEKVGNSLRSTMVLGQFGTRNTGLSPEEQLEINARQQARTELQARITELQAQLQGLINGPDAKKAGPRGKLSPIDSIDSADAEKIAEQRKQRLDSLLVIQENYEEQLFQSSSAALERLITSEEYAEARRTLNAEEEASARITIAKNEFELKQRNLFAYADAAQAVGQLLGQETASGKALAVAAALINTYAAIAGQLKAFAGVPVPGYAIAQAIATGAFGLAQVKQILAVKVPGGEGGGVSGTSPSTPPAFNVIGNSPQNQLNQALLSQNREPVRAFVVEGEVSTAEQLRRNKIATSSL